jgi:hypothetical protein
VRERVSHPVQLADSHEAVSRQGTQALVSHGSKFQYSVRSSCQFFGVVHVGATLSLIFTNRESKNYRRYITVHTGTGTLM